MFVVGYNLFISGLYCDMNSMILQGATEGAGILLSGEEEAQETLLLSTTA